MARQPRREQAHTAGQRAGGETHERALQRSATRGAGSASTASWRPGKASAGRKRCDAKIWLPSGGRQPRSGRECAQRAVGCSPLARSKRCLAPPGAPRHRNLTRRNRIGRPWAHAGAHARAQQPLFEPNRAWQPWRPKSGSRSPRSPCATPRAPTPPRLARCRRAACYHQRIWPPRPWPQPHQHS